MSCNLVSVVKERYSSGKTHLTAVQCAMLLWWVLEVKTQGCNYYSELCLSLNGCSSGLRIVSSHLVDVYVVVLAHA